MQEENYNYRGKFNFYFCFDIYSDFGYVSQKI